MEKSKVQKTIESMPILTHRADKTKPYDQAASEVLNWMSAQPVLRESLFNMARKKKWIEYDAAKGKWRGVSR